MIDLVGDDAAKVLFVEHARLVESTPVDRLEGFLEIQAGEDLEVAAIHDTVAVEVAFVDVRTLCEQHKRHQKQGC